MHTGHSSGIAARLREQKLDKNSDFALLAQAAIEVYYHIPYPGLRDARPKVNRKYHGGTHASSTALNIDLLISLYQKYNPEFLTNSQGKKLSPAEIKLLKLAAIYHDTANTSETEAEEKHHADNFRNDMKLLGFTAEEIEPFALAIQNKEVTKDKPEQTKLSKPKSIYQTLLEDADRLDIIRVIGNRFDINRMDIVKILKNNTNFQSEMKQIVENHHQTTTTIYGKKAEEDVDFLHKQCEYASNTYHAVHGALKNMLLEHIVIECIKQGRMIAFDEIELKDVTLLDLYNRKNSPKVLSIINTCLKAPVKENFQTDSKNDYVMQMYADGGCYSRTIRPEEIDNELEVLHQNSVSLREHKITDSDSLRAYIANQAKNSKVWTPPGFKWRPSTFIEKDLAVELFRSSVALIIDPKPTSGTIISHVYKKNATSSQAATGTFIYDNKTGSLKDKSNTEGIRKKFREISKRRTGEHPDPSLHYYAKKLSHSEALGTYRKEGIAGIIVSASPEAAKKALIMRAKLGHPLRPFYQYSAEFGLQRLDDGMVVSRANILSQSIPLERKLTVAEESAAINNRILAFNRALQNSTAITLSAPLHFENHSKTTSTTQTISFKLTGKKEIDEEIRGKFNTLKKRIISTIEDYDDDRGMTKEFVVKRNDETISLTFTIASDYYREEVVNMALDMALSDIEEIMDLISDEKRREKLINELETSNLQVKCVSGPLLDGKPLRFEFPYPDKKEISCIAHVKNNIPYIEFNLPNGKKYECKSEKVNNVARNYFHQRIVYFNKVLSNLEVASFLKENGIDQLKLNLVKKDLTQKNYIAIEFDLHPGTDIVKAKEVIIKLLCLENPLKLKSMHPSSFSLDNGSEATIPFATSKKFIFSAPDISNIDYAILQVSKNLLIEKNVTPQVTITTTETTASSRLERKEREDKHALEVSSAETNRKQKLDSLYAMLQEALNGFQSTHSNILKKIENNFQYIKLNKGTAADFTQFLINEMKELRGEAKDAKHFFNSTPVVVEVIERVIQNFMVANPSLQNIDQRQQAIEFKHPLHRRD